MSMFIYQPMHHLNRIMFWKLNLKVKLVKECVNSERGKEIGARIGFEFDWGEIY